MANDELLILINMRQSYFNSTFNLYLLKIFLFDFSISNRLSDQGGDGGGFLPPKTEKYPPFCENF
jgi:hypothetical protein